jgi:predicted acylesterase/phospholipase RssA
VFGGSASLGAIQVGMLQALSADRICPLAPALVAEGAMPGIHRPVVPYGRRLYDGGMVNAPIR